MKLIILNFLNHCIASVSNPNQSQSEGVAQSTQSGTSNILAFNRQLISSSIYTFSDNESENDETAVSDYSSSSERDALNSLQEENQLTEYQNIKKIICVVKDKLKFIIDESLALQNMLDCLPKNKSMIRTFLSWKRTRCYKNFCKLRKHLKYYFVYGIANSLSRINKVFSKNSTENNFSLTTLIQKNTMESLVFCKALKKLRQKIITFCNLKTKSYLKCLSMQVKSLEMEIDKILIKYPLFRGFIKIKSQKMQNTDLNVAGSSQTTSLTETLKNPIVNPSGVSVEPLELVSLEDFVSLNSIFTRMIVVLKLTFWLYFTKEMSLEKKQQHSPMISTFKAKRNGIVKKIGICQAGLALLSVKLDVTFKQEDLFKNFSLQDLEEFLSYLKKKSDSIQSKILEFMTKIIELKIEIQTDDTKEQIQKLENSLNGLETQYSIIMRYHKEINLLITKRRKTNLAQNDETLPLSKYLFKNRNKLTLFNNMCQWLDSTKDLIQANVYDTDNTFDETNLVLVDLIDKVKLYLVNKIQKISRLNQLDYDSTKSSSSS
ncbi:hypothetical protein NUSPORA_02477 [Nucleospora cyclopteri]